MAVSLAFRFITGTYAATAWDSSANSGAAEWPPSPWRILRALLAVAHERLDTADLESITSVISSLSQQPPSYLLPPAVPHHTRHYLPDWDHRTGGTKNTSLTLNGMLSLSADLKLYVSWPDVELSGEQQAALDRCTRGLSYLGRAESLVEAELVPEVPTGPGHDVLLPGVLDGRGAVRVLCPRPSATRADLEITPEHMRKSGFLTPPGAQWVAYAAPREVLPELAPVRVVSKPTVVRWAISSRAPFKETYGILATDRLRSLQLGRLRRGTEYVPVSLTGHFPRTPTGQQATSTGHDHAHWLWLAHGGRLTDLVLWVPAGIDPDALPHLARPARVSTREDGYTPKGFVDFDLQLVGIGRPDQVATELTAEGGGSRYWQSSTPYLLTKHMKPNRDLHALLQDDIRSEWEYRQPQGADIASVEAVNLQPDVRSYRRYRWKETMSSRRPGFGLRVEFTDPISGPLNLGALSHFGFGQFRPASQS